MDLLVSRFVFFAAEMVLFGSSLFALYAGLGRVTRGIGETDADAVARRIASLVRWASLAAVVAGLGWLFSVADRMAGDAFAARPIDTLRLVLEQTHFGRVWQEALTLAGLLAGVVWAARSAPQRPGGAIVVLVFSAGLLVSAAAAGHGAMDDGAAGLVHFTSHTLHLMAGAAWIGGLVPLSWVLRQAASTASAAATAVAVRCLVRFSSIGLVAVATLVLTGLVNAAFLVGDLEAAWTSDYGRVLLLKVALVAAMIATAALNRLRWLPGLDPARMGPETAAALAAVFRNVVVEQGLALMVLAAAALLGTLAPPFAG